jgi:hypothetical protein
MGDCGPPGRVFHRLVGRYAFERVAMRASGDCGTHGSTSAAIAPALMAVMACRNRRSGNDGGGASRGGLRSCRCVLAPVDLDDGIEAALRAERDGICMQARRPGVPEQFIEPLCRGHSRR